MTLLGKARVQVGSFHKAARKLKTAAAVMIGATFVVPLVLSWFEYSTLQVLLAMILLDVCLYPTFRYMALQETCLPLLPVLCMSFAVQYAMPIFTQEPRVILAANEVRYLEESHVVAALAMSILGVVLLQMSYYLLRRPRIARKIPAISLHLNEARAELFCVVVLVIYLLIGRTQSLLPEDTFQQFSAVFTLLQNQLLVAIVVLAWLAFSVRKHKRHLIMLYSVVLVATLRGFATTMMEMMIVPLAVLFIARWAYTRRIPVFSLGAIALAFLFFSPVKMDIRSSVQGEVETTGRQQVQSRASEWILSASRFWVESFQGKRPLGESTADASSRADLIHEFAYIYSFTPSVVSYQNGSTYSYLLITWIPRMLWPEKPVANYANNFYAIEYGVSSEEGVKTSSFGATLMGEGYMNFGVTGVALIMIVLGSTLSLMERVFGSDQSGVGGQAILLVVFAYFLNGIGSSAEIMFGGIVQNLVCGAILIGWARAPSRNRLSKLKPARVSSHG